MTKTQKKAKARAIRESQKKIKMIKKMKNDYPTIKTVEVEEKTKRFIEAEEMELFDAEGRHITRWKGIVNKEQKGQMFNIVGRGYKIAQHDDVIEAIEESVNDLELTHNERIVTLNEGARVHAIMNFPKIVERLSNGETLELRVTFDNSYDSTTGLRMVLGSTTSKGYYLLTSESYGTYYHRHTKGMDTRNLKKKLEKGIDVFRNKIIAKFEQMLSSKLDIATVINFLDKCIKEKVISVKYLEMIRDKLDTLKASDVDSQYALYNMIAEVLSAQVESIDAQKRHMETMYNKVKQL